MAVIAFVTHQTRTAAVELATEAIEWLSAEGHEVRVTEDDAAAVGLEKWARPDEELVHGVDLAVSLGGDGTMLRTVDIFSAHDVPVLGVNVGQLGYLTEVEPAGLRTALQRFLAGDYGVEERMTLEVVVETGGAEQARYTALNEAMLEKNDSGHTVRIAAEIDGRPFLTYAADGIIVATPTGSTAYNLSARGPVVSPRHRALLMTPVSPHMLFDRCLVLDPSEWIRLEVLDDRRAVLVVDGNSWGTLGAGDAMICRAGSRPARLVSFGGRDFHNILKAKFGLADR